MATAEQVQKIRELIGTMTVTPIDELISNPRWGSISFESARRDLELLFALGGHLRELPVEIVPDGIANQFVQHLTQANAAIKGIKEFTVETGNPPGTRDALVAQVRQFAEQLLVGTQNWIAFLAYQKGDVQRNIQALSEAVANANRILEKAKGEAEAKANELTGIITAAREASASAGVGVFTRDFAAQVDKLDADATKWLTAAAIFAGATILVAFASFFVPIDKDATSAQIVQYMTSKLLILLTLLTGTIWCGRIFKATKHQSAINGHRANALKTFQAFVKAGSDDPTRNAVLIETTRSIFAIAPSGYLETTESAPDSGTKFFEIFKNVAGSGK